MYSVSINNSIFEVEKSKERLVVNGNPLEWDVRRVNDRHYHLLYDGSSFDLELVGIDPDAKTVKLKLNNKECHIHIRDKYDVLLEKLGMNNLQQQAAQDIKAPMPGLIFDIKVQEGEQVKKGDTVLILEAMKMENIIKAPRDGIIRTIKIKKGQSVEKNQVLVQF